MSEAGFAMPTRMRMFRIGVFVRYLFTATGVCGVLLQLLLPEWQCVNSNGAIQRQHVWFWQQPVSMQFFTSASIDWFATLGPAVGMFVCVLLWWKVTGRAQRRELSQFA